MSSNTICLHRTKSTETCTLGKLNVFGKTVYTLEDPIREHKIYGETGIPAGRYKLELRNEGGMTKRYKKRFGNVHKGMLWLRDVPYFDYVYIHVGNYTWDTEGCILVGMKPGDCAVFQSVLAYKLIYSKIVDAIVSDGCYIEIFDV